MCRTCSCLGVVATKFGPYFRSPGTPHLVATLPIVRVRAKRGHRGVQAFYCGGLVPDALRLRWGNNLFSSFNTQSNAAIGAQVGDWQCERVGRSGWAERIREYSQCDRWRIKAGGQSCAGAAEVLLVIGHARLEFKAGFVARAARWSRWAGRSGHASHTYFTTNPPLDDGAKSCNEPTNGLWSAHYRSPA